MSAAVTADGAARSKTVATWLAIVGGTLGWHRLYLHGLRDLTAWLHPLPTLIGLAGVIRMRNLGQDDVTSWLLIPFLGLMISVAMASAIVIGLTPDEKWSARFGGDKPEQATAWGPILGVILALLLGGAALMGTIAFAGQKVLRVASDRAGRLELLSRSPARQAGAQNSAMLSA